MQFDLTPAVVSVPACDDNNLQPGAIVNHEASNDSLPSNKDLLKALYLSGNDLPNNTSLADIDTNSQQDSFDNLLLADRQSDLLDNNTLTNANKDVQIGPNPSLDSELDKVLPPAETGTVPKQSSKSKAHKSKPDSATEVVKPTRSGRRPRSTKDTSTYVYSDDESEYWLFC